MMKLYKFKGSTFTKLERPDQPFGIAITMPVRFFEDYPGGEEQFRSIMSKMNDHDSIIWGQTISAIPKQEVGFVYLVFGGRVQYRLSIVDYERNVSKQFNDGGLIRCFSNKNWVNLCAPVIKAPREFLMRGFQGFRYTSEIF